ncbi:TetR/AcrR family transcriptional regulator [Streptomyces sp. NPDC090306]|uniref:TetR/AcrR family transcriptional regulator n=1 Tax=unclassified Streptomyces TaxID=2593676 RepID=UPI0036EE1167
MPMTDPPTGRRREALTARQIVRVAIELLDEGGESALTFRTLAGRLATGPGAIYHHVESKAELLRAATSEIVADVSSTAAAASGPDEAIRTLMLGLFDVIHHRPWVGAALSSEPWQTAMLQIFEDTGRYLDALGVPEEAQFDAASSFVNYVLGVAGQWAAVARTLPPGTDRTAFLTNVTAQWTREHDDTRYPFVHRVAEQMASHDDRQQFLAGIGFLLAGTVGNGHSHAS